MVDMSIASTLSRPPRTTPHLTRGVTSGLAAVGGAMMIAGAILPWLSVYGGLEVIRGINGLNGRIFIAAGSVAFVLAAAYAVRPVPALRWTLAVVGFGSAGFAAWVVAQLLGSYQELGTDVFAVPALGAGAFVAMAGALCILATLVTGHPREQLADARTRTATGDARTILLGAAVAFLLGAALVHLAVVGPHFSESTLYATFFVAAGAAQIVAALVLTLRPSRRLLVALAVGNALVIVVWGVSRTTGLPIGPTPGVVEGVSLPDVLATISEAVVVVAAVLALRARRDLPLPHWLVRAGTAAAALAAAAVTVLAVIGVQAGGG